MLILSAPLVLYKDMGSMSKKHLYQQPAVLLTLCIAVAFFIAAVYSARPNNKQNTNETPSVNDVSVSENEVYKVFPYAEYFDPTVAERIVFQNIRLLLPQGYEYSLKAGSVPVLRMYPTEDPTAVAQLTLSEKLPEHAVDGFATSQDNFCSRDERNFGLTWFRGILERNIVPYQFAWERNDVPDKYIWAGKSSGQTYVYSFSDTEYAGYFVAIGEQIQPGGVAFVDVTDESLGVKYTFPENWIKDEENIPDRFLSDIDSYRYRHVASHGFLSPEWKSRGHSAVCTLSVFENADGLSPEAWAESSGIYSEKYWSRDRSVGEVNNLDAYFVIEWGQMQGEEAMTGTSDSRYLAFAGHILRFSEYTGLTQDFSDEDNDLLQSEISLCDEIRDSFQDTKRGVINDGGLQRYHNERFRTSFVISKDLRLLRDNGHEAVLILASENIGAAGDYEGPMIRINWYRTDETPRAWLEKKFNETDPQVVDSLVDFSSGTINGVQYDLEYEYGAMHTLRERVFRSGKFIVDVLNLDTQNVELTSGTEQILDTFQIL